MINALEGIMSDIKSLLKRVGNLEARRTIKADETIIYFGASNDVNIYRGAAHQLKTDDNFLVGQTCYVVDHLALNSTSSIILWSDGAGGYDVNIYRGAANQLKTDDPFYINQNNSALAEPCLTLNQADIDDQFINFIGTSAADKTRSISTLAFLNFSPEGMVRVEVNGAQYWIPYYS